MRIYSMHTHTAVLSYEEYMCTICNNYNYNYLITGITIQDSRYQDIDDTGIQLLYSRIHLVRSYRVRSTTGTGTIYDYDRTIPAGIVL